MRGSNCPTVASEGNPGDMLENGKGALAAAERARLEAGAVAMPAVDVEVAAPRLGQALHVLVLQGHKGAHGHSALPLSQSPIEGGCRQGAE